MLGCPISFGDCPDCKYYDPSDGACEFNEEDALRLAEDQKLEEAEDKRYMAKYKEEK